MKSIEITESMLQSAFVKYLSNTIDEQSLDSVYKYKQQFSIRDRTQADSVKYKIYPIGEKIPWKFNDETIYISIIEEGKALYNERDASINYFNRILIENEKLDILKMFLKTIVNYKEEKSAGKNLSLYTSDTKHGYWKDKQAISVQRIDDIYISKNVKDSIISKIDKFYKMEDKYIKYGRQFKTSFLLCGVVGSGKTSLVKAIASRYELPVYILNITRDLTDDTLTKLIGDITQKCIILLEDIDSLFMDRTTKDAGISFSAFLNIMDGALSNPNGTIVFATANNPEYLDISLLRVGRMDTIIKFDYPNKTEIKDAFMHLVEGDTSVKEANFESLYTSIRTNPKITMSAIVDYLFNHSDDYMENLEELSKQHSIRTEIINDKVDKVYM